MLRTLHAHLVAPEADVRLASPAAAAAAATAVAPPKFEVMVNRYSDSAAQGFGRVVASQPPKFRPDQHREIVEFFNREGFAVIIGALSEEEVAHLNEFYGRTQKTHAKAWGLSAGRREGYHNNQGLIYSQPLLDHPELDIYTQHPGNYAVVCELLVANTFKRS